MKKNNFFTVLFVLFMSLSCSLFLASCSSDDDDNKPDPNAGKTDPSTIAASNLIAYFPFESETASISKGEGIAFNKKAGAASFVVGRRGNAYKGSANQAYLEYNVAANNPFKTMSEFTIAAWIKTPPAIVDGANGAAKIFALDGGDGFMGNLVLMLEGNSSADSLDLKGYLYNSTTEWRGQDIRLSNQAFLSDKWVHIVFSYNKATSAITLYASGLFVSESIRYSGPEVDGNQPLLGALTFGQDMAKIQIGAWAQQIASGGDDWMRYYPGLLDELRIYNKALTETEIKALYDAEITQINE